VLLHVLPFTAQAHPAPTLCGLAQPWCLLVQARALNVDLSPDAAEAGARAVSDLAAKKAWEVVQEHLISKGEQPCFRNTLPKLFINLVAAEEAASFAELVAAVEPNLLRISGTTRLAGALVGGDASGTASMREQHDSMRCLNLMLRQQAKLDVDQAVANVHRYEQAHIICHPS
jgi:hypothetical protein